MCVCVFFSFSSFSCWILSDLNLGFEWLLLIFLSFSPFNFIDWLLSGKELDLSLLHFSSIVHSKVLLANQPGFAAGACKCFPWFKQFVVIKLHLASNLRRRKIEISKDLNAEEKDFRNPAENLWYCWCIFMSCHKIQGSF